MVPMKEQIKIVKDRIARAERSYRNRPEGTLIVSNRKRSVQFYLQTEHGAKRTYLPKKEEKLIRRLAQSSYDKAFLLAAKSQLKMLETLEKERAERSAEEMYRMLCIPFEKLSVTRKKLVKPYILPTEDYIAEWENQDYEQLASRDGMAFFLTEKGDRVRSKSEKIIADKLYREGIPYRYEEKLNLRGITVHPDFTILNVRERTTHYLEHFGMMSNPEYCRKALSKIATYEKYGYRMGREFLCTFESEEMPLDLKMLERVIEDLRP